MHKNLIIFYTCFPLEQKKIQYVKDLPKQFYQCLFLKENWIFECYIYYLKNDHKIILICRLGSEGVINSTLGPWWCPAKVEGPNSQEKYGLFTSGGQINGLKYKIYIVQDRKKEQTNYFECRFKANLSLNALI